MNIPRGFALATLMTLAAGSALAGGFSLNDAANAIAGMQGGDKATSAAPTSQTAGLPVSYTHLTLPTKRIV